LKHQKLTYLGTEIYQFGLLNSLFWHQWKKLFNIYQNHLLKYL
jgi:hypothetical protein